MRIYKFPKWLKWFYPGAIWDFFLHESNDQSPVLYLTFDDGPNSGTTAWILHLLESYNARATFFLIGKNVEKHPDLMAQIQDKGHSIGNHSYSHMNGWYTANEVYLEDINKAAKVIPTHLFRPPYGKVKPSQYRLLKKAGFTTVFWSHISYDFDSSLSSEKRIQKTLEMSKNGSVIIFHDSDKAFPQLQNELPYLMEQWQKAGYRFEAIR